MRLRIRFRLFAPALLLVALVPLVASAMGGRAKAKEAKEVLSSASTPGAATRGTASLATKPSGYGLDDYLGRGTNDPTLDLAPPMAPSPRSRKVSRSGYGLDELP